MTRPTSPPTEPDLLLGYLQTQRDTLVWKLEGLGEYELRRPMTPTATNLLGLVKHLAGVEIGYIAEGFERPFGEELAWMAPDAPDNADMWATAEESSAEILDLYRRAWGHTDRAVAELGLDAPGSVPWWAEHSRVVTMRRVIVHLIAETARHAGHADIVRELIDGAVGHRQGVGNLPDADEAWWDDYRGRLETVARAADGIPGG